MIKAKTNTGDMLIGVTDENIRRLTNGEPIKLTLGEVFPDIPELQNKICIILHGKNETEIMKDLPLGPNTKFNM